MRKWEQHFSLSTIPKVLVSFLSDLINESWLSLKSTQFGGFIVMVIRQLQIWIHNEECEVYEFYSPQNKLAEKDSSYLDEPSNNCNLINMSR